MPLTGPVAGVYTNTGKSLIATVTPGLVIATVSVGAGAYACAFAGYLTAFSGTPTPGIIDYDNMALQSDPNTPGIIVAVCMESIPILLCGVEGPASRSTVAGP